MRKSLSLLCILCALSLSACLRATIPKRAQPSPARIGLVVEKDALLALGLESEVTGELRQHILESRLGVPVEDNSKADLLLKVKINSANFTAATQWEWQLVDVDSGAIVLAQSENAPLGDDAGAISDTILLELSKIDTAPYAGPGVVAVVPMAAPAPTELEAPASGNHNPNAWAVVIGVENYRDGLSPATGAERDAQAFASYARQTLGVPEANVKVLLGQRAARADMAGALLEWLPRNAVEPGGQVYIFFSGHGAPDTESGDAYLVPYDANPAYLKTGGLPLRQLQETLGGLKNQQVYVFLDACFSGQGDRSVLADGTRPLVPVKPVDSTGGVVTFSASQATETTGAHASSGHGLFTHYLLEGMGGGADSNQDHDVSLAELRDYVSQKVKVDARRQNRDQTPSVAIPDNINADKTLLIKALER